VGLLLIAIDSHPKITEFDERDEAFARGSEKPTPVARVDAIDLGHNTIDLTCSCRLKGGDTRFPRYCRD
jgi:hypothetical protein